MDSSSATRLYDFDEPFIALVKFKCFKRKLTNSPLELHRIKLLYLAGAILFIQNIGMLVTFIRFLQSPHLELSELSEVAAVFSACLLCFSRGFTLLINQKKVKRLLKNLEDIFPVTKLDQVQHQLNGFYKSIIFRNKVMQKLLLCSSNTFLIMPILQSLFDCIINGQGYTFRYPLLTWYPFDDKRMLLYPLVYSFQIIACMIAILLFFNEDLLFSISVAQICMYYRYLSKLLSELDARRESRNVQYLKKVIRYQYYLEDLRKDVDGIFSIGTFIGFTILKISLCMFMFSLFHGIDVRNMLSFVFCTLALIFAAYLRCSCGTDLYEASKNLINSIYDHNWYEGTPKYRKMITIMMIRANRPVELEASKLNRISVGYFKEIMVETYQIFMFLHNFST